MKYIVYKETALYLKLFDLWECCKEAKKSANDLVRVYVGLYGGSGEYYPLYEPGGLGGGVKAIQLDQQPKNWRRFKPGFYFPGKLAKADSAAFEALPIVKGRELNTLIGHKEPWYETDREGTNGGRVVYFKPDFFKTVSGHFCIGIPEDVTNYSGPVEGMVEITLSEYKNHRENAKI